MAASFLIEFRLHGLAKSYARWARERVLREAKRLGLKPRDRRFVPHISLFGPASTNNLHSVIAEIEAIGRKYGPVRFDLGIERGEFQNREANWLYLEIRPSSGLEGLRHELAQQLLRSERAIGSTCQSYDRGSKYRFHCSIGKFSTRDPNQFGKLSDFARTECSFDAFMLHKAPVFVKALRLIQKYVFHVHNDDRGISQHLLRITVLGKRSRIEAEYDLALKRLLSRRRALSRRWWRRTIYAFKQSGGVREESLLTSDSGSIFFIGDTHFDHKNIIKYCHRPFSDVAEMNETIKRNWNRAVSENDTVYFLGDWGFGQGDKPVYYWQSQLNGVKRCVQGSHDPALFDRTRVLRVGGYSFLLVHDPQERRAQWRGWIIHGHVHNNRMDRYPFINGERKTINMSAELIDYRPVSLAYLLYLDLDSIRWMRTVNDPPEHWEARR